jgi:uncharacterized protein
MLYADGTEFGGATVENVAAAARLEAAGAREPAGYRPLPLTSVTVTDGFWAPRIRTVREQTLPYLFARCRDTGRLDALRLTWQPGQEPAPHIFWESDLAKWIEAASYSLSTDPDPELSARVDEVIELLAAAQLPDGYLNVYFTVVEPGRRWTDLRDAHELYCAGHLIEAGVAHVQATGKHTLLDVVRRYADHIESVFGPGPGQKRGYCGHPEIELALVKLYRATGSERYLRLAEFFTDERGSTPYYFDQEAARRGTPGYFGAHFASRDAEPGYYREYNQSHAPVREQPAVVGHAVRAMYLYSAMADIAAETGDERLARAGLRLWRHLTTTRLYLTGGVGSAARNEGFSGDHDLPNETAYAETCAAVGLVFWAHRLALSYRDRQFTDVLEQALYNGVLSGIALDGTHFYYANPLASPGGVARQDWFGVACCPPNIARLLTSLRRYAYARNDRELVVHLFIAGSAEFDVDGSAVRLRQQTDYPWDGAVRLSVAVDQPTRFALAVRLPGWCREPVLRVNDAPVDLGAVADRGYARIERDWHDGDRVDLDLPMPVERRYAHPAVDADLGQVALTRGPLVYCVEGVDNAGPLDALALSRDAALEPGQQADLPGIVVLRGAGLRPRAAGWDGVLYRREPPEYEETPLVAVPYFAWANRGAGPMRVWLREAP